MDDKLNFNENDLMIDDDFDSYYGEEPVEQQEGENSENPDEIHFEDDFDSYFNGGESEDSENTEDSEEADESDDKSESYGFDDIDLDHLDPAELEGIPEENEPEQQTDEQAQVDVDHDIDFSEDTFETLKVEAEPSDTDDLDGESLGLDLEIAKLEHELAMENADNDEDEDSGADDEGSILDNNSLMDEPEKSVVVSHDNDFISETGDIQVMDPVDNGDNFKLIYIDIENIAIVKRIRKSNNVEDLVKSIRSTGLLEPLTVAPTAADGVYVLLDGYRRILACARCGKRRIPCVVNLKVSVPDIPIIEAMYNHSKKYGIQEIVEYIDYLEKQKGIMSASMIEYLLQMNSGDYTKLKDILNDDDEDIVSKLMAGTYDIATAFKKLEQRRKKESAEERELKKTEKAYDSADDEVDHLKDSGEYADNDELSEEEMSKLAINASELNDVEDEDLGDLIKESNSIEGFEKAHKQDPKYRERLDPKLRKSVLVRDDNTCKICGISGMEFVEVLDIHHIQEVYLGGSDDIDNLITACTVCHKLIHLYGRGELHMRPIEELSESEQLRFKKIVKLGTIIRKGMALKGIKKEQLKNMDNTETIGRTKPGTGQVAG